MSEPIDKDLHFHFELITEPSNPAEETKSNGDTIAEEHFNDTETENADQRRQANLQQNSLLDKKESTLNFAVDSPDMLNHDELRHENEYNRIYPSTYQRCRQKHISTETDLNSDNLSAPEKKCSWKTTRKISRGFRN